MQRQFGNPIYQTVVVVWLTLSIASVVLAAVTWIELARKLEQAQEAVALRDHLNDILKLLLDSESAQRGFSLTGDESHLERISSVEVELPLYFERLSQLVKDDRPMLALVMELRARAEVSLTHQQAIVATRRRVNSTAEEVVAATAEGKLVMDDIRSRVTQLSGMRPNPATAPGAVAEVPLVRAILTSLVAGVMGVGAGGYALRLSRIMLGHQARERRLVEAKLAAERSSREKTFFLANMSHEIRTPMNAILGFSELLVSELRDPKHQRYLHALRTSAISLLQLINDILDMSKIEAGVMELRPEPTDPREICDFLQTVFSEPAAKKDIRLICRVMEDLPRALLIDRIRLRQVLVNLLGNAVKFTDKGVIEVRVEWQKNETGSHGTLLIEVQDTGVGIPEDRLDAIFRPFVQAQAHADREKAGTGLGLAIVRRLTETMGGTVTAASVMGQGSAFSLRFPEVVVSARLAPRESGGETRAIDFNRLRPSAVLVVDDNETNRQLMAGMFDGSHHQVCFGSSGSEAVEQARDVRPDLILLDVRMPDMDGMEALDGIRRLPGLELTPVIAVTASTLGGEEERVKELFNGYLRKPFSREELFNELSGFLPPQDSSAPGTGPSPADGEDQRVISAELLRILRGLLQGKEWTVLRESLAVNDCGKFAGELLALAQQWQWPPLERYARTLADFASNYAVVEMEHHLLNLPASLHQWEKGMPS